MQETYLRAFATFGSYRGGNTRAWLAATPAGHMAGHADAGVRLRAHRPTLGAD